MCEWEAAHRGYCPPPFSTKIPKCSLFLTYIVQSKYAWHVCSLLALAFLSVPLIHTILFSILLRIPQAIPHSLSPSQWYQKCVGCGQIQCSYSSLCAFRPLNTSHLMLFLFSAPKHASIKSLIHIVWNASASEIGKKKWKCLNTLLFALVEFLFTLEETVILPARLLVYRAPFGLVTMDGQKVPTRHKRWLRWQKHCQASLSQ